MPIYNLLEYSKNYSKTSGSLWNYYTDELTDDTNDNNWRITGADGNPANNPNYD